MELYDRLEQLLEGISMDFIRRNLKPKLKPYNVVLTNHFYNRARERGISNKDFLKLLNKLFSEKNKEKLKNIKSKDILVKGKDLVVPFQRKTNDMLAAKSVFKNKRYITKKKGQYQLDLSEKIKKVDNKWVVYASKGGDRLGTHNNRKDALKQLAAIEISKRKRRRVKETFYKVLEEKSLEEKKYLLEKIIKLIN
jgi:GMP synthase PP-ATPase subunit